jgi:hypothetical protein
VRRERRERGEQRDRLEPRDLGVAALHPAAEAHGQPVRQEIGVEEAALGGPCELQVKREVRRAVGRLIWVTPSGDVLAAAGQERPELDLSGH